jgi:hypothetical protein
VGALKFYIAPWRRKAIASDIAAIDRGEGRKMYGWFRGLYGSYPRTWQPYFMILSPDGLAVTQSRVRTERRRIPITEELLSARTRMHESYREAFRTGAGGPYADDGRPVFLDRNAIISCETPLGVLEFVLKQPDLPVFMHYIDRLRQRHHGDPTASML